MRLAIVLPPRFAFSAANPNSIETVVRTFARASRYRDSLVVLCDASEEETGDLPVLAVPGKCSRRERTRAAVAALRGWRPDLIELHQHAPTAATIARAMRDIPSIYYRHNHVKEPERGLRRWRHLRRYRSFNGLVTVSESAREAFVDCFPELAARTRAVPNAIDPAFWSGDAGHRAPCIAFAGRAAPEKGLGELAAALAPVLNRWPEWTVDLLLGAWETHADWAGSVLAPLSRFGDRVRIRHNQPQATVRDTLARASIAVVPSRADEGVYREAFGLAAVEAQACGAALISSGTGGLREASGEHALYLPEVSAAAIETALNTLIADPAAREAMARAGQHFVHNAHTVERRAALLDDFREQVLRNRSA